MHYRNVLYYNATNLAIFRQFRYKSLTHDEIEIQERGIGHSIAEMIAEWPIDNDQIGAIFCANNSWGVEIFDKSSTYAGYHESLLRSFASEASEASNLGLNQVEANPRKLLDSLWGANWLMQRSSGMGKLLSEECAGVSLCALVWSDTCVSASASGVMSR